MKTIAIMIIALSFLASHSLYARVRAYSTKEEVLERVFPGADIEERRIAITPAMRKEIEGLLKRRFFKRSILFYIVKNEGDLQGYATVAKEVGKTKQITFMVILDKEGVVKMVSILVFRESQGYEVANHRWRKQFVGKTVKDPLRLKRDIANISGATLSSRAITRGVKKVLTSFEVIRPFLEKEP